MAHRLRVRWEAQPGGLTRRDRRPCDYDAYIPDLLSERDFVIDGEAAADVADAERALTQLNSSGAVLADTEAIARLLLKAESVASSRIEGLEIGGRRLLHADLARRLGDISRDVTAMEVLNNIDSMTWAIEAVPVGGRIEVAHLLEAHRRLLAETRLEEHAGRFRTDQNWIGGSGYNPCSASYVPPPPELLSRLMEDLCAFCNDDGLPAVMQTALAHAQFETIHPFVDGNGRTGRLLIHLVLRRRGLATRALPPISLVLATFAAAYIDGLMGTRYEGSPQSDEAHQGTNRWVQTFAGACVRAAADAATFEIKMAEMEAGWRERLGSVRRGSTMDELLRLLPATPVVTAGTAVESTGKSFQAVNTAIARLTEARILDQVTVGRRNRAFEAREVIDAFTDFERRLASPSANTRISPPGRPVAARPRRRGP